MNTSKIKSYAIQARRDFLKAVTERANAYGIFADDHIEPIDFKGDMAIIGECAFTKREGELREKLVGRVERDGFTMVMRSCAYTWFNRFIALRYMEIHGYLEHGYRVLSNSAGSASPDILEHAADIEFHGIDKDKIIELKLAGTKDNELYRLLILAQCDDLHKSMPFLFDRIDNETELLLPDNLLHSDSPIRKLVTGIDENDWNDVEIIGWIYQFYISERKDEVIGKVVKSEDIPAATQLFTPNWIVKYMVQNTLGRMWMATYPDSPLKNKMEYYIEPAEQEPEVNKKIAEITPKELNPEEITFLDPACGSGHILVEAYDIFKEIYLERGYRTRDISRLIMEKNLFGIDIDNRAIQLACFAILMKARKDDRRVLERYDIDLNVMPIIESKMLYKNNLAEIISRQKGSDKINKSLIRLIDLFENGKTFGSLISIDCQLANELENIEQFLIDDKTTDEPLINYIDDTALKELLPILKQAKILSKKYDVVITNPPYMGSKYQTPVLKRYLIHRYNGSDKDLFSAFIQCSIYMTKSNGRVGFVTPYVWMFINSHEFIRKLILNKTTLCDLVQLEYNAFEPACIPVCSFTFRKGHSINYKAVFIRLSNFRGITEQGPRTIEAIRNRDCGWLYDVAPDNFQTIPGSPLIYWASSEIYKAFSGSENYMFLRDVGTPRKGMATGDNKRFVRLWSEVNISKSKLRDKIDNDFKWVPYNNGGNYRKWYGNIDRFVNWENDGYEIRNFKDNSGRLRSRPQGIDQSFQPMVSWTSLSSSFLGVRFYPGDFISDQNGNFIVLKERYIPAVLAFLCSSVAGYIVNLLNPTMHILVSNIANLPIPKDKNLLNTLANNASIAIKIAKEDWDIYERSWNFNEFPLIMTTNKSKLIRDAYRKWLNNNRDNFTKLRKIEQENNLILINFYGLNNDLSPDISTEMVTLTTNSHYRYGGNLTDHERESQFLHDTMTELISYAIGCMMGRYSLDHPGLIYAQSGNIDFEPSKYKSFPADDDGIIPIMDQDWFPDDATNRFAEFIKVAWSSETFDENLKFVVDILKPKRNETPIETIRRYMSTAFFKDHLKTYKKRPIYWLFSSGKQKAFECLVYLHRYNESTLSRIRSSYVTPLQSNFTSRLEFLLDEKNSADSTSAKNKIQKEIDNLQKKKVELSKFDDELRHYADMKISLDLDDGVKVNYGKFGKLLAEKKAITGK